jgi:hypothetical protein
VQKNNLIHGETEIILKNPKTGLVDRVRSENTFQSDILARGLRYNGAARSAPFLVDAMRTDYTYKQTLGGLLLFRDAITVGSHYMPAGNRMTGNGYYGGLNGGDPTELGSFNTSESSFSHDACTQVYDFTTSQANGRISCVSLTSKVGGMLGYGNPSRTYRSLTGIMGNTSAAETNPLFDGNQNRRRVTIGNTQYVLWALQDDKIYIRKYDVDVSQYSVFGGTYSEVALSTSGMHTATEYRKTRLTWGKLDMFVAGGKIYFTNTEDITYSSAEPIYYWVYDPSNDTFNELTFNWPLASTFVSAHMSICHGLIIFVGYNTTTALVFNQSTGAYVEEIGGWGRTSYYGAREFHGGLINISCSWDSYMEYIYDPVNHTCYPMNGVSGDNNVMQYEPTNDGLLFIRDYYSRYENYVINSPLYLATINNLGTPVIKDATRTMKVLYRLERV